MKFSNGYWMVKEGYTVLNPVDVRDVHQEDGSLTVYAAARKIQRKGDTLNGAMLTCELSSPLPDIIRVRWTHHAGKRSQGPAFELFENPQTPVSIDDSNDHVTMTSGGLSVKANKHSTWGAEFSFEGRRLTGTNSKGAGHITTANKEIYFREQLESWHR